MAAGMANFRQRAHEERRICSGYHEATPEPVFAASRIRSRHAPAFRIILHARRNAFPEAPIEPAPSPLLRSRTQDVSGRGWI